MLKVNLILRFYVAILVIYLVTSLEKIENRTKKSPKTKKNILVNIFLGGRSHNYVIKELFN